MIVLEVASSRTSPSMSGTTIHLVQKNMSRISPRSSVDRRSDFLGAIYIASVIICTQPLSTPWFSRVVFSSSTAAFVCRLATALSFSFILLPPFGVENFSVNDIISQKCSDVSIFTKKTQKQIKNMKICLIMKIRYDIIFLTNFS